MKPGVIFTLFRVRWGIVAATLVYLAVSWFGLLHTLQTKPGIDTLLEGDTGHYLRIAREMAAGDLSMSYVRKIPHRQPLYPLVLSMVMQSAGENLFWLGMVNVCCAALSCLALYFFAEQIAGAPAAGLATLCLMLNTFLFAQTTTHLLTEPLHVLWMVMIIPCLTLYWMKGRPLYLLAAGALIGADYLTRPNGLFVMLALLLTLALCHVVQIFRLGGAAATKMCLARLPVYLAAIALFILVSIPSWWPRWQYYHSPLYHGYLSNYMWVDQKQDAHTGDNRAIYTAADYFSSHGAGDVLQRTWHGVWKVIFQAPFRTDKWLLLFILATAGVIVVIWRGSTSQRLILVFGVIQLLPLIWTNLSNPTVRVPWGAFFPMELFMVVFLVQDWKWRPALQH